MPNKIRQSLLFLFFAFSTAGAAPKIRVLTTVNFLEDLSRVLLDSTPHEVESLMGPGVDPHLYRMAAKDLSRIRRANLILAIGLHLEGKVQETLLDLQKKKPVIFVGDWISSQQLLPIEGSKNSYDPHIWFDPNIWLQIAEKLKDDFSTRDPERAAIFDANYQAFAQMLRKEVEALKKLIESIPSSQRVMITSHDAFRYFGRAFGIEVHGILGVSTDAEVGIQRLDDLAKLIRKRKLRSIFVENSVPQAAIEGLKRASGCEIGGELFGDSLGDRNESTGQFLGMLRHNVETIVKGLK